MHFGHANALRQAALLGGAGLVMLAAVYFSFSKGALLWSTVGVCLAVLPLGRRRAFTATCTLLAIIAGIVIFGLIHENGTTGLDVSTTVVRVGLWETALWVIQHDHYVWLLGDGLGGVAEWSETFAGWFFFNSHNTWLDQIVIYGLPAFFAYILMWLKVAVRLSDSASGATAENRSLLNALLGANVALAGTLFFEPRADGVFQTSQVLFLFALSLTAVRLSDANPTARPQAAVRTFTPHRITSQNSSRKPMVASAHAAGSGHSKSTAYTYTKSARD